MKMGVYGRYMTADQIKAWAKEQEEGSYYCEHCLTKLVQTDEGSWYCPNEMCLWDDEIIITEEE